MHKSKEANMIMSKLETLVKIMDEYRLHSQQKFANQEQINRHYYDLMKEDMTQALTKVIESFKTDQTGHTVSPDFQKT